MWQQSVIIEFIYNAAVDHGGYRWCISCLQSHGRLSHLRFQHHVPRLPEQPSNHPQCVSGCERDSNPDGEMDITYIFYLMRSACGFNQQAEFVTFHFSEWKWQRSSDPFRLWVSTLLWICDRRPLPMPLTALTRSLAMSNRVCSWRAELSGYPLPSSPWSLVPYSLSSLHTPSVRYEWQLCLIEQSSNVVWELFYFLSALQFLHLIRINPFL